MILIIDNYDSFTHNLADAVGRHTPVQVIRNDAIDRDGVADLGPDGIILSPGPGHPAKDRDFGVCRELIQAPLDVPMLGVCLGMQGMALYSGGDVAPAPELVHGEATEVDLAKHALFEGIATPTAVGRYHSLCVPVASLPDMWEPLASIDGMAMAIAHRSRPWSGMQFHPESILTPAGPKMIENFVRSCA